VHEKNQVLCEERFDVDLRIVDGEVDDDGVELTSEKSRDQRRRATFRNERPDIGVGFMQTSEELRHEPSTCGSDDSETCFSGDHIVQGGDVCGDFTQFAHHSATVFENDRSLVGELASRPVDQDCPDLAFQSRNVRRDVRLNGIQSPSGGGEGSVVGDGDEGLDLPDIHLKKRYQLSLIST
jgi:hypothetical protein